MNNLRKFATEADYSAATLNYPAVSWVVSGDSLHYDLSSGTPMPEDIMIAFTATETYNSASIVLWNYAATDHWTQLSSMTINNVDIEVPMYTATIEDYAVTSGETYIVKYGIDDGVRDFVQDTLTGTLGGGWGSSSGKIDFYIPSSYQYIGGNLPINIENLIVNSTTPPYVEGLASTIGHDATIYVPDSAVDTYKEDSGWSDMTYNIFPISEYNGSLPI